MRANNAETAFARRAVPANAAVARQIQGHRGEKGADVVSNYQAGRPGTEALVGDDQLLEEAVVARIAGFKTAPNPRRVATNFAVLNHVDAIDQQVAK